MPQQSQLVLILATLLAWKCMWEAVQNQDIRMEDRDFRAASDNAASLKGALSTCCPLPLQRSRSPRSSGSFGLLFQGLHLLPSVLAPSPQLCMLKLHIPCGQSIDTFSLRLFLVVFIKAFLCSHWFPPPQIVFLLLHWFCNWDIFPVWAYFQWIKL